MVRALHRPASQARRVVYLADRRPDEPRGRAAARTCLFTRVVGDGLEALAIELAERRGITLDVPARWLRHVGLDLPSKTHDGYADDAEIIEARARCCRTASAASPPRCATRSTSITRRAPTSGVARLRDHRPGGRDRRASPTRWAPSSACPSTSASSPAPPRPRRRQPSAVAAGLAHRGGRSMKAVNLIPADERAGAGGAAGRSGGAVYIAARRARRARPDGRHAALTTRSVDDKQSELRARRGAGRRPQRPRPRR